MNTAKTSAKSVLIVQDNPMSIEGFKKHLSTDRGFILTSVDTSQRALALFRPGLFSAAIVDLEIGDKKGIWALRKLACLDPLLPISAFSYDVSKVHYAFEAGARGFLAKHLKEDLADKIDALIEGLQVLDLETASVVAKTFNNKKIAIKHELTKREAEILDLIAKGYTAVFISSELNISVHTVRACSKNIYSKMGVRDKAAAVAEGYKRGVLG